MGTWFVLLYGLLEIWAVGESAKDRACSKVYSSKGMLATAQTQLQHFPSQSSIIQPTPYLFKLC